MIKMQNLFHIRHQSLVPMDEYLYYDKDLCYLKRFVTNFEITYKLLIFLSQKQCQKNIQS